MSVLSRLLGFYMLIATMETCFAATTVSKSIPDPKIVIVGAGVSGIGAAVRLIEHGFKDVTVLEAESRIGGRIHTIPFGKNVIDLGAQWCHGENYDNQVYALASKSGLLEHSNEILENVTYARSNAETLPNDLVKRLRNMIEQLIETRKTEANDYEGSIGSFQRQKFAELLNSSENAGIDKKLAMEFYQNYEKEQSCDEGSDALDFVSAKDYNLFGEIKGDYFLNWKDKGYKEFLRLLMKTDEIGKDYGVLDEHLKLNKKVEHISWQRDNYKTLVKCEDGEKIKADHVIVTVSLGVLKANFESMFEPPLPAEKQKLIKALEFGSFNKIFLEFPSRFWHENWGGISFLWREEDLNEFRNSKNAWLESVIGFNTLPYQPDVLEGWIIGPSARDIEVMPLEEIKNGALYLLRRFINSRIEVPEPTNVTISKWFNNPNFRGCYSYYSLDTEKADVSNQFLANTLRGVCDMNNYEDLCEKPVLQFAGEATHTNAYATVQGALETGFREAQKIEEYYELLGQKTV